MTGIHLVSVNRAQAAAITIGSSVQQTGIGKLPVTGIVPIGVLGVEGDFIGDTRHHGGADQAVYLYSQEDYDWWSAELGRLLPAGIFGENLTVSSFGSDPLRVGDRYRMGAVLLEISGPRIPCATLATRVGEPTFVRKFADAGRPGAYARVLDTGNVESGLAVSKTSAPDQNCTVAEISQLWHSKDRPQRSLDRLLSSPLAERHRDRVNKWLADSSGIPSIGA